MVYQKAQLHEIILVGGQGEARCPAQEEGRGRALKPDQVEGEPDIKQHSKPFSPTAFTHLTHFRHRRTGFHLRDYGVFSKKQKSSAVAELDWTKCKKFEEEHLPTAS